MKKFNRTLPFILSLVLVFLFFSEAAAKEKTTVENSTTITFNEKKMGDTDKDGKLTANDARIVLRCSVKLDKPNEEILLYGDYDKDGKLSADDARTALRVCVALDNVKCILHGHKLTEKTKNPTCTKKGYTQKLCQRCSFSAKKKTDVKAALGHSFTEKTTPPTCTEDGIFTCMCTVCNFVKENKTVEYATGHSFGIWQINGEKKSKTCRKCKLTETEKNEKTIYLTFDDGPGAYTAELLSYLREYGVKATFFVTNQFPQYKYLLKEIVNDGHGIGVHSLTHQWAIYSSEQSYTEDFNAMHRIILDETGTDTKLFRFPGGTNNTVSRRYSWGIMTSLTKRMTDMGFFYFDWNVDSGDTKSYSPWEIANTTINQIKNRHSSVVLMHDIKASTVTAVKEVIRFGLDNGYKFEVIDESTPRVQFSPVN